MKRRFLFVLAAVAAMALPAIADDISEIVDPTGGWQLYRFESVPAGAAIEYRGVARYFTNAQFEVDTTFLSTIRLLLDGYMPCHFAEGSAKPDRIGLTGSGIKFVCRMVRDRSKADIPEGGEGPASWEVEGGPGPQDRDPIEP